MKNSGIIVILIFAAKLVLAQPADLEKARGIFFNRWEEDCATEELFNMLNGSPDTEVSPVLLAYRGVARAGMAECVTFPFTKLNYFNQGKSELEEAVLRAPDNVEIRFIRFAMQTNIPSLLGYDHIEEDKKFIIKEIKKDPSLRNWEYADRVYHYLIGWDGLADAERDGLKKITGYDRSGQY
ncbi:MAG: hypothetical protein JXA03_00180 [Bacteroidales bacterium]|nr:hypothetical protein [Bacteroidales bacterium]